MTFQDFIDGVEATDSERLELLEYLLFIRWRSMVRILETSFDEHTDGVGE